MSANAVISNLNQAKNCTGKCNCCANLQSQINQLKKQVAAIKPVDENKIIKQSVAGAEALLLPAIGTVVAQSILPLNNKILGFESRLSNFGNLARQALSKANIAGQAASSAGNLAAKASNVGSKALSVGQNAANTAGSALSKYGAVVALGASLALSIATLNILGGRIDVLEGGLNLLGNDVSKILGQLLGVKATAQKAEVEAKKAVTEAVLASETATDAEIEAEKALKTAIQAQKAAVTATGKVVELTGTSTNVNASTAAATATAAEALALANQAIAIARQSQVAGPMDSQSKNQLNEIQRALGNLNISLPVALAGSAIFTTAITSAAASGVCKSTAPGGCLGKSLSGLGSKVDKTLINTAGIGTVSGQVAGVSTQLGVVSGQVATNTGLIRGVSAQVAGVASLVKAGTAAVLSKFGAINALIIAKFAATWAFLTADRTLNVFNAAANLHNAYMLSGSLSQTLFSIVDNIGGIFFKDAGGQSFSTSQVLGKSFDNWAKGVMGVTTWEGIKAQWKTFNRIYQSGANIINSARSMFDSVRNVSEFIAENTGRIGNALKAVQVIRPDAFKWMPEQVNAQSIWSKRLENFSEAASGIEMITSEVLSVSQNLTEIQQQAAEFKKSIEESQPKTQVENTPIKTAAAASKAVSTFPNVAIITSDEDKEPDE